MIAEPNMMSSNTPMTPAERAVPERSAAFSLRVMLMLAAAVAMLIVTTALLTARSLAQMVDSQLALKQTVLFDKSLHTLQVQLLNAETGQRGYLLTGHIAYLQPYFSAVQHLQDEQLRLAAMPLDDPQGKVLLADLQQAIDVKLQELERTVQLQDAGRHVEALEMVRTDAGKQAMDAARRAIDALDAMGERQTQLRREAHGREVRNTFVLFGVSMLVNLLLLGGLVHRMRLNALQSRANRAVMQARNAELAGLLQATTARSEHIHALSELSRYLQSALDIDEAARLLQQYLPQLLRADSGALYLMAASRNQLRRASTWGEGHWADCLEPNECWALRRGQPLRHVHRDRITACAHLDCDDGSPAPHGAAGACLPLVAHGDLIGLLVVGEQSGGTAALPTGNAVDDEHFRQMTLEQVALSIGNLRLRESLRQQSIRDVLTGLYNRRFLEESVHRELLRAGRLRAQGGHPGLALLMLDVDHFKRFNDQHGHDIGDEVLREVAQALQRNTRGSDVAARYGGEEFVVVLPDTGPAAALQRAEELRQDVERLSLRGDGQMLGPVTLSVGVACWPADGGTLDALVQCADKALYDAKRTGRNRVVTREPVQTEAEAAMLPLA
jgi:diguanylate cyclase (GGDEF)-like protein